MNPQRRKELLKPYLGVCSLCLSEHQHGIDLVQADKGAVSDVGNIMKSVKSTGSSFLILSMHCLPCGECILATWEWK